MSETPVVVSDIETATVKSGVKKCQHRIIRGANRGKYCDNNVINPDPEVKYCNQHMKVQYHTLSKCTSLHYDGTPCEELCTGDLKKCKFHRTGKGKKKEPKVRDNL